MASLSRHGQKYVPHYLVVMGLVTVMPGTQAYPHILISLAYISLIVALTVLLWVGGHRAQEGGRAALVHSERAYGVSIQRRALRLSAYLTTNRLLRTP